MKNLWLLGKFVLVALFILILTPREGYSAGELPSSASNRNIAIQINGKIQDIPADMGKAFLDTNTERVMIPVRFVAEELGYRVRFTPKCDSCDAKFDIEKGSTVVHMEANKTEATKIVDGEARVLPMDAKIIIHDGRSYIPLRFLTESMGCSVEWRRESAFDLVDICIHWTLTMTLDTPLFMLKVKLLKENLLEAQLNTTDYFQLIDKLMA